MKTNRALVLVTLFTMISCGDDSSQNNNTKTDAGLLDTRPATDVGKDTSTKKDLSSSDMGSDQNVSDMSESFGRTLADYRSCQNDVDCPVGLGQCIKDVTLNRQDAVGTDSVPVSTIIDGLTDGEGICTRVCTLNDSECSGLSANGVNPDAEPFVCQIVVVGDAPYPDTPPAFPFDNILDPQSLEDGIPFGAICRPPFQLDKNVDRGLCAPCFGGVACPGSAICWNSLTDSEAADGEAGECFGGCSDSNACPGGFTCEDLGGQNHCRPILDTCTSCLDRDKDGKGNGRCGTQADPITDYDCDDFNADRYYDALNPNHAFPNFCSLDNDYNCNGISDAVEEIGTIDFGNDHCSACFDECRGAVPNGESNCIASVCSATCTDNTKWADCDGDLTNGCEQAVDDPTRVYYRDRDQDQFGDPADSIFACDPVNPPAGYVRDNTDCDDGEITIHPGAAEICDDIDQDCNILIDDNFVGIGETCNNVGTVGACSNGGVNACVNGSPVCEQVVMPTPEICNNLDDDCDGQPDEDPSIGPRYCPNVDGDSYGDCANSIFSCQNPGVNFLPYSNDPDIWDCNDADEDIYPFRTEDCATPYDDDCDNLINTADTGARGNETTYVLDPDNDGYGADGAALATQCEAPALGWSPFLGFNDCSPNNPNINPGETETCATLTDDNCNNDIHDAPTGRNTYYLDTDNDGYGVTPGEFCGNFPPLGYSRDDGDCNDSTALLSVASNGHSYSGADQTPGNMERCEGYDNNCNGTINDGCPEDFTLTNYRMQGNSVGVVLGTVVDSNCPAGEVLVGLAISVVDQFEPLCTSGGGVWAVAAECANPSIGEDDQSDPFLYSQIQGTVTTGVFIGAASPDLGAICNGLNVTGSLGCTGSSAAVTGLKGRDNPAGITNLGLHCKEHSNSDPSFVNPTTITMDNATTTNEVPSNFVFGDVFNESCANNEVAVGVRGTHVAGRIRSLELRCADIGADNQ